MRIGYAHVYCVLLVRVRHLCVTACAQALREPSGQDEDLMTAHCPSHASVRYACVIASALRTRAELRAWDLQARPAGEARRLATCSQLPCAVASTAAGFVGY